MNLSNKIVVVTGASQGLGKSIAVKAASAGATVCLLSRSKELLDRVRSEIGDRGEVFVCDVRNFQTIKETVAAIMHTFGRIDILVNNAGVWTDNELESENPERRKDAFETNALGMVQMTDEVLPHLKKQGAGHILNVISTAGYPDSSGSDNTMWSTYGATKWAAAGFTKALRESLKGSKIKVSAFYPGGFDSNLYEYAGRDNPHAQPWMMKTDDVADVVLFALTRPVDMTVEQLVVTKMM